MTDYTATIRAARDSDGGHMLVTEPAGASFLWAKGRNRCGLSGIPAARTDGVLAEAVEAGCVVIDARAVSWDDLCDIVIGGPMVACGAPGPDSPPYGPFTYAPLAFVVEMYRKAGAEIHNA